MGWTLWIDCRVQAVAVLLADVNKHWTSVFTDLVLIAYINRETFFTFSLSTGCVMYDAVVVTAGGSPVVDVRPQPAGAASKSVVDLHLELFLDETKALAQSVVECIKENGPDHSIDEVINQAFTTQTVCCTGLVIGWQDFLQNDLLCAEWDVKLYPSHLSELNY